jgi:hypothetical protein
LGYLLLFTELPLVDIFTIVGSIATTLSAFAALWTLLEVKKQREQSNMPDILLWPEKRFYLFRQGNGESTQYQHWNETHILDEKTIETIGNYKFSIDCFNIGIESAKNIEFKYEIDIENMKSFLESLEEMKIENFEVSENINYGGKLNNHKFSFGMNIGKVDLCFIQPFIEEGSEKVFKLKLPQIYLYIFNTFILAILNKEIFTRLTFNDKFPPIFLNISYEDIAGKPYLKKYSISLKIDSSCADYFSGNVFTKEVK